MRHSAIQGIHSVTAYDNILIKKQSRWMTVECAQCCKNIFIQIHCWLQLHLIGTACPIYSHQIEFEGVEIKIRSIGVKYKDRASIEIKGQQYYWVNSSNATMLIYKNKYAFGNIKYYQGNEAGLRWDISRKKMFNNRSRNASPVGRSLGGGRGLLTVGTIAQSQNH